MIVIVTTKFHAVGCLLWKQANVGLFLWLHHHIMASFHVLDQLTYQKASFPNASAASNVHSSGCICKTWSSCSSLAYLYSLTNKKETGHGNTSSKRPWQSCTYVCKLTIAIDFPSRRVATLLSNLAVLQRNEPSNTVMGAPESWICYLLVSIVKLPLLMRWSTCLVDSGHLWSMPWWQLPGTCIDLCSQSWWPHTWRKAEREETLWFLVSRQHPPHTVAILSTSVSHLQAAGSHSSAAEQDFERFL